jgi:hypothetical protein
LKCFVLAAVAALGLASSASAGNIVLTGHDDDFHQSADAKAQMTGMAVFARNGSGLPVLTFDNGTQLTSLLSSLSIPFTNINPNTASQATIISAINSGGFSAIAVASDQSCGGCDNNSTSSANLSTAGVKAAIANFVNAGHGIIGLAGATNPNYYAFLPSTAGVPAGFPPSTGYVQTADGLLAGIGAVNGDATHNFFNEPGTGGTDAAFKVFERLTDPVTGTPETIGLKGGFISVSGFGVPEPGTLSLAALALLGAVGYRLRRRKPDAA